MSATRTSRLFARSNSKTSNPTSPTSANEKNENYESSIAHSSDYIESFQQIDMNDRYETSKYDKQSYRSAQMQEHISAEDHRQWVVGNGRNNNTSENDKNSSNRNDNEESGPRNSGTQENTALVASRPVQGENSDEIFANRNLAHAENAAILPRRHDQYSSLQPPHQPTLASRTGIDPKENENEDENDDVEEEILIWEFRKKKALALSKSARPSDIARMTRLFQQLLEIRESQSQSVQRLLSVEDEGSICVILILLHLYSSKDFGNDPAAETILQRGLSLSFSSGSTTPFNLTVFKILSLIAAYPEPGSVPPDTHEQTLALCDSLIKETRKVNGRTSHAYYGAIHLKTILFKLQGNDDDYEAWSSILPPDYGAVDGKRTNLPVLLHCTGFFTIPEFLVGAQNRYLIPSSQADSSQVDSSQFGLSQAASSQAASSTVPKSTRQAPAISPRQVASSTEPTSTQQAPKISPSPYSKSAPKSRHIPINISKTMGIELETLENGNNTDYPKKGDSITVHYVGVLTNGTKFDSSRDRHSPFKTVIGVGLVIRGWDEGIPYMSLGQKAKLTCNSDYAYGERGFPGVIPPNSTLVFIIELLAINDKKALKPW